MSNRLGSPSAPKTGAVTQGIPRSDQIAEAVTQLISDRVK
jgi:hypothetical protein